MSDMKELLRELSDMNQFTQLSSILHGGEFGI